MDHESLFQRPLPEDHSIICIHTDQCIEHCILIGFVRNMSKGPENFPTRCNRDLRHRTEHRLGEKLSHIRCTRSLIGGLWIIVGAMIRMAPAIGIGNGRFGDLFFAEEDCTAGVCHTKKLFFTHIALCRSRDKN